MLVMLQMGFFFLSRSQKELVNNPDCPRMCAYKLVTVKFKWWGLQTRVENLIHDVRKSYRID